MACRLPSQDGTLLVPRRDWLHTVSDTVRASVNEDAIDLKFDVRYDNASNEVRYVRQCARSLEGLENGEWRFGWGPVCVEDRVDAIAPRTTKMLTAVIRIWTRPRTEPRWRLRSPPKTARLVLLVYTRDQSRGQTVERLVAKHERASNAFTLMLPAPE